MQILSISFLLCFGAFLLCSFKKPRVKPVWAVIFPLAALAMTALSFFVYKTRFGGTIMYRAHGWPHFFAHYQIGDVIDKATINRWLFLPGNFYSYIIADFIFYFSVLIFVYFALRYFLKERR